jgi:hypothetical protein
VVSTNEKILAAYSAFPVSAIEAVLGSVCENLESDFRELKRGAASLIAALTMEQVKDSIDIDTLMKVKNEIGSQFARAEVTKQALDDVLANQKVMAHLLFVEPATEVTNHLGSVHHFSKTVTVENELPVKRVIRCRRFGYLWIYRTSPQFHLSQHE